MPLVNRQFPETIRLDHDLSQWYADHLAGIGGSLESYGPGKLTVNDPRKLSLQRTSFSNVWELDGELSTARKKRYLESGERHLPEDKNRAGKELLSVESRI